MLALLIVLQLIYKQPFLDFTLSKDGIQHTQKVTKEGPRKFWGFITSLGGGKEIYALLIIFFFFASRSRFMYFIFVFVINQFFIQYFKLAYHDPRPYMLSSDIHPFKCSI